MIGFYDYTVVLTYISLASSMIGMTQAIGGRYKTAIFCLAFSGLCDMFDGKIARSKKNRTPDEKCFGMQIDSLCDVVCFGAFPALICYLLGVRGLVGMPIIVIYIICSVIRLGYFNVLETTRQQEEEGATKYYHGLPITTMAIVLPLAFMTQFIVSGFVFVIILHIVLLVVGILFVVDFKLKKPNNKQLAVLVFVVALALSVVIFFTQFRIPRKTVLEVPNIDEVVDDAIEGQKAEGRGGN
ncbi:MAG: CDP-alcohol phosphatidyltransferase family protein [Lachnospiraceae bacterium]|nr:CDP-alcohol phosphatidyltransferase family protein [Lachnospiraceae bacterium]